MAFENLIQVTFTNDELERIDEALKSIEGVLRGKTINLTPAERQQYGSIAEQNKLFVNKSKELMEQYPQYVPSFLDKTEFDKDFTARNQIEARLQRLKYITEQLSDTKVLLDHDNYYNALTFYKNVKFLKTENVPGIKTIYDILFQFFSKSKKQKETPTEPIKEGEGQV